MSKLRGADHENRQNAHLRLEVYNYAAFPPKYIQIKWTIQYNHVVNSIATVFMMRNCAFVNEMYVYVTL